MRRFALLLLTTLVFAGCGGDSKKEYDAKHGDGAWDRAEESEWESEARDLQNQ